MLTTIRDEARHLQAVCEWWLVDDHGHWTPEGHYVFVNQLEMNPGTKSCQHIRFMIDEIARLVPQGLGVYWERRDKTGTRLHAFRRQRMITFARRDADALVG